jgi:predicted NBD/HSP70 family sugar kinase
MHYLGVDLGGTKVTYVLANDKGDFLFQQTFASPFKKTQHRLPDGSPAVYLDSVMTHVPIRQRSLSYLVHIESQFLKEAKKAIGIGTYDKKGMSLCGKTWIHENNVMIAGGNTPARLFAQSDDGESGVVVAEISADLVAAHDGNAAATAQGIYYLVAKGIAPKETGYLILGTGFGFGVPEYFAPAEVGHTPVSFMPELLRQECGCTQGHKTSCVENYASGRGIQNTALLLLSLKDSTPLGKLAFQPEEVNAGKRLYDIVAASRLTEGSDCSTKKIMQHAKRGDDDLAVWIVNLAAVVTAHAVVNAALQFGLKIIGIGETLAQSNPWYVDYISEIIQRDTRGNTILKPPLRVELTPLRNPSLYGALALVVPEEKYETWAERMKPL